MAEEHEEGTSNPGECPGCDAKWVWDEIDPIIERIAAETGRTPGELAHHTIRRYAEGMCAMGGVEQIKSLLFDMLLVLFEHNTEAVRAQEGHDQQTKH